MDMQQAPEEAVDIDVARRFEVLNLSEGSNNNIKNSKDLKQQAVKPNNELQTNEWIILKQPTNLIENFRKLRMVIKQKLIPFKKLPLMISSYQDSPCKSAEVT